MRTPVDGSRADTDPMNQTSTTPTPRTSARPSTAGDGGVATDMSRPFAERLAAVAAAPQAELGRLLGFYGFNVRRAHRIAMREALVRTAEDSPDLEERIAAVARTNPAAGRLGGRDPALAGVPTAHLGDLAEVLEAAHLPAAPHLPPGEGSPYWRRIAVTRADVEAAAAGLPVKRSDGPVAVLLKVSGKGVAVAEHGPAVPGEGCRPTGRALHGMEAVRHLAAGFGRGGVRRLDFDPEIADAELAGLGLRNGAAVSDRLYEGRHQAMRLLDEDTADAFARGLAAAGPVAGKSRRNRKDGAER